MIPILVLVKVLVVLIDSDLGSVSTSRFSPNYCVTCCEYGSSSSCGFNFGFGLFSGSIQSSNPSSRPDMDVAIGSVSDLFSSFSAAASHFSFLSCI